MSQNIVSVVVPYYKNKKFIKKAIDSIMNQSYKNFEILLIYDDPSKSDLSYIKNNFTNKKIKLIINKENQGAAKSRNIAMKKSKGKFIAFLDSDDFWKKDKLKKQLEFMRTHSLDFSYTAYNILNKKKFLRKEVPIQIEYKDLLKRCDIGLSTVIINRKLLKLGNFPSLKTQEDFALWLKYARNSVKLMGMNETLATWRNVTNSLSSNKYQKIADAYKVFLLFEKRNIILSIFSVIILTLNKIKKNLKLYKSLF
tara:strand:- start:503 stop:1264 length:762 start_codon:yes stop_codon:yes gene_type:complete